MIYEFRYFGGFLTIHSKVAQGLYKVAVQQGVEFMKRNVIGWQIDSLLAFDFATPCARLKITTSLEDLHI